MAGFGTGSRFHRGGQDKAIRIAVVSGFLILLVLAIGVPILSKPKSVALPVAPPPAPTPIPEVAVFMPQQRIAIGSPLLSSMFRREQMSLLAVGGLGGQVVRSDAEVTGRFARTVILPGRPLMVDQLMDAPDNLVVRKIVPGYRAATIRVDDVSGIEGWGMPGARVDILFYTDRTTKKRGDTEPMVTTIVRNAQVLSVLGKADTTMSPVAAGGDNNRGADAANAAAAAVVAPQAPVSQAKGPVQASFTVTLLVSPQDGQKLFLAQTIGRLSLMLRGEFETATEGDEDSSTLSTKRLLAGAGITDEDEDGVQGTVRIRRDDGTYDEWSVVENKIVRWQRPE